jgi:hypothetical protein
MLRVRWSCPRMPRRELREALAQQNSGDRCLRRWLVPDQRSVELDRIERQSRTQRVTVSSPRQRDARWARCEGKLNLRVPALAPCGPRGHRRVSCPASADWSVDYPRVSLPSSSAGFIVKACRTCDWYARSPMPFRPSWFGLRPTTFIRLEAWMGA